MPSSTGSVRGTRQAGYGRRAYPAAPPLRAHHARVVRVRQLSPSVVRISFVGEELATLPYAGADQRVKLLLPTPGGVRPYIDGMESVWELLALPDQVRPVLRTFTVRHHRAAAAEIDIDFVAHPGAGLASAWAATARPGDRVAVYGPLSDYEPPEDTQWQLVAGDSSALPAIAGIVESLRHYDRARVLVEIDHPDDAQHFDTAGEVEVTWLPRRGVPAHESRLLLDAVCSTEIPDVPKYVWLAGEAAIVTAMRRSLIAERGVAADDISYTAYWRHGRAEVSR